MQIATLATGLAFPEGPAFAPDGSLWFVELEAGALTNWHAGVLTRRAIGGQPNGLAFDARGDAWICDAGRAALRCGRPHAEHRTLVAEYAGRPMLAPNDLVFDALGNCLFTCPGTTSDEHGGYVCCRRPDGTLSLVAEQLHFPNGLVLADDGTTLIVAETYQQRLWRGAWDATAAMWHNPQPWVTVGGTSDGPDGMALAADGLLYVAVYSLGCLQVVAPDGRIVQTIALPGNNPTNCAFDPADKLGLVVTEAERGLLLSMPLLGPGAPLFAGPAA